MKQLTELTTWESLEKHAQLQRLLPINNAAKNSDLSNNNFEIHTPHMTVNFQNQKINQTTVDLLLELAHERNLKEKINALIRGDIVNQSENRPALHTALRVFDDKPIWVDGRNIIPDILTTREKMRIIATQIRDQQWIGYAGRAITDIVNIGIGGSDFGPRFCVDSLAEFVTPDLNFHFISDADPNAFERVVAKLKPETTLFIVSSKSFTTTETLYNAKKAVKWLNNLQHLDKHFIAVTANPEKAKTFGISNVLPIWDWVGGRYSLCSAINLITCIAVGYEHFIELLAGANSMDEHFANKDFHENLPVIMALIGLWNINFLHIQNLLILVYAKQLELLVPYIQQLDMESNGKSIDNSGRAVNYGTGPIVWGGLGNQAQHSYYQLLCQGTHRVAVDLVSTKAFCGSLLNSFCDAKIQVLSKGIDLDDDSAGYIKGGVPINHINLNACTPANLGALIALYEHKVYVQSVLWNINSFDQPGVESAKRFKALTDAKTRSTLATLD